MPQDKFNDHFIANFPPLIVPVIKLRSSKIGQYGFEEDMVTKRTFWTSAVTSVLI